MAVITARTRPSPRERMSSSRCCQGPRLSNKIALEAFQAASKSTRARHIDSESESEARCPRIATAVGSLRLYRTGTGTGTLLDLASTER
jgi:hypothetical protein